ncbi:MAG: acylneuraminate cytidylyltransferase family protein [Kiritimatiellia bacterium]|jgi:CMP-N-acetylneuraminic acid synthetase|nr:acylneuraminate cytidylyltransferase family protein [Kiritimatiellia bacterium]MDP6809661.1 acylneuraminate cytidylyltransferase family protein [Kiritimatiellia bacterium]MDP7023489.1 acylneuraminate cytidylyltransferase family protein [Kiritimatiellia bacterium]
MIHNRAVAALVPIKDHSERVAGKNFRGFCGKPLYHHIVHTLDKVYAVDEILINTDSPRVALEAPKLSRKVRVIERPDELKGDFVSTNKLFAYDLEQSNADIYVQTHATNPLLRAETIAKVLSKFLEEEPTHDSLFTVNAFYSRFYRTTGEAVNHKPAELIRTQDLDPMYEENSTLYVFTKESFAKHEQRIGDTPYMYVTPPIESTDIDDEFTFRLAEMLAMYARQSED